MKSIQLGGICSNFHCALCCRDTKMILSQNDIKRIETAGYKIEEFSFKDEEGFIKLKNIENKCYFLQNNKCSIYLIRPQGCKFYPIIYDLDEKKAILDPECPLIDTIPLKMVTRFTNNLKKFIQLILKEKEEIE
ncbi:MAG: YkgJ family cysteine cluster protein [Candidatus Heimdallarchaeota archaeon]|nr:YkgJ family cysteine cluster protein [Candidatus Heimdallarchaeota archaeon]